MTELRIPDKNLKIITKPLYRSWQDVIETYRRPRYKMLKVNKLNKLLQITYRKPMTVKELANEFNFPYNEYQERQLRLSLATFVAIGIMDATRRLRCCGGRPPYQYESKYKTLSSATENCETI